MNNLVQINDNQVVVSSKQIAKSFNKQHFHVIRDIENLISAIGISKNGDTPKLFCRTTYIHKQNKQEYPMYLMNRDGFSLLVMGFTGKEALEWKIKYIEAFNEMENQLKSIKEDDLLIDDKTGFRGVEPIRNNTTDIIRIINGTLFTNSCIVAEKFGIAQADIVENIKRIIKALSLNPAKNMYFTRDNLNSMLYYITQEGFSLITMGFTSQKAIIWKAIFLKDFNSRQAMCNGESIAKDRILTNSERLGILSAEPRLDIRNNDVFKNQLEAIKKDMTMVEYMIDNFPTVMHPSYFEGYFAVLRRAFLNLYNKIDDIGDIKFNYIHK